MIIYVIGTIVLFCTFIIVVLYRKTQRLSKEATMLVAFIKRAMNHFKDEDLLALFNIEQSSTSRYGTPYFDKVIEACFFMNRFLSKTQNTSDNFYVNIKENGPCYGTNIQVGIFRETCRMYIMKIIDELPDDYKARALSFVNDPLSEESKALSDKIESNMFCYDDKTFKWAFDQYREGVVNYDYLFTLFK